MNKYRFKCVTEDIDVCVIGTSIPTECPNDAGHEIASDIVIMSSEVAINASEAEIQCKCKEIIYQDILLSAEPVTQLPRILTSLDKLPSVSIALDNVDYQLASARLQVGVDDTILTSDDKTFIEGKFPTGWDS